MIPRALKFEDDALLLLDQRRLPSHVEWKRYADAASVAEAIRTLVVRGAPAIGIAAAYGVALAAKTGDVDEVGSAGERLESARPTAVNLHWAVARMVKLARNAASSGSLYDKLLAEAKLIHQEDEQMCRAIGRHGLELLGNSPRILTYCNAGALATGGIGTALAPIYLAHEAGQRAKVYACETRPVMQGARLTAWELSQAGVDVTMLVDGAAAFLLARHEVQSVWVGADRIAANGDVANKIGTHALACAAAEHGIPFYVAAPQSTFDASTASGEQIAIEFRPAAELTDRFVEPITPTGIDYWTPAFDITPAGLVSAYVTDTGLKMGGRGQKP